MSEHSPCILSCQAHERHQRAAEVITVTMLEQTRNKSYRELFKGLIYHASFLLWLTKALLSCEQPSWCLLQDTYNWAVGKSSDAADKVSGAAKEAESDASGKASSLKKDADKDAGKAQAEAKGYVASAQDSAKVCLLLQTQD